MAVPKRHNTIMQLGLDNIEAYAVPMEASSSNWLFRDEHGKEPAEAHKDQIIVLNKEASSFLWHFEGISNIVCSREHFKSFSIFQGGYLGAGQEVKKYLYQLGIPFRNQVFVAYQPGQGYVLTWKMVIKYAHHLFRAHDQTVWDRTMNWKLEYHHDGEFTFGRDLIYDGQQITLANRATLEQALREMEARKRNQGNRYHHPNR